MTPLSAEELKRALALLGNGPKKGDRRVVRLYPPLPMTVGETVGMPCVGDVVFEEREGRWCVMV